MEFPDSSSVPHPLGYQPNTGRDQDAEGGTPVRSGAPIYEAISTLGYLAGRTRRCRLGIGVLVIPYRNRPDQFVDAGRRILELAQNNGRDPSSFTFTNQVRFQVLDHDGLGTDDLIGRPQRVAGLNRAFDRVGVDHLQLKPRPGPTTDATIEQADRFVEQVVPLIEDLWQPAPLLTVAAQSS
jgi:alkanesulfonate monooxygenase SsuD/methylene tetrahydromethanopterin reductase-like flavin-dependent oxidoreductase (luciferase family)